MAGMTEKRPHLLHVFSSFAVGGQQRRFVQLANIFGARYRHSILSMDHNFAAATELSGDVLYALETMPVRKTAMISVANLFNARRLLRRIAPDLLVTYNWGTIEWAVANRLPTMCRHLHLEDGFGSEESAQHQLWRRAAARRLLLASCDRIIVPSQVLEDIATRIWRLPIEKVDYLPNGIDCDRFAIQPDNELISALQLPDDALVVGTVAALRQEKNLTRLVRAFASIPRNRSARLVIIGEGPERAALEREAARLDVSAHVVFVGSLSRPERLLRRFDIFALTSDTEQMPYSVLEAMAAGLPVVSTDVGDIKRMLAHENAKFVVPVADEKRLARQLFQLSQDPLIRGQIGKANEHKVRSDYSIEHMVNRYAALFSLASGNSRGGTISRHD